MFIKRWLLLIIVQVVLVSCQRPFWIIGHMVNSEGQIEEFLDLGANAIEADVSFHENGDIDKFYHGAPCDCLRNCFRSAYFGTFINHTRRLSSPGSGKYRSGFVLLMLDLKLSNIESSRHRQKAGAQVASNLIKNLWLNGYSNTQLRIHLSIPNTKYLDFAEGFREALYLEGFAHLDAYIGYDVSSYESIPDIVEAFRKQNIRNIWQADGASNCLPRGTGRLSRALNFRDYRESSEIKKVYFWTVDRESTAREVLDLDADGIISNHPDRVLKVLQEPAMSSKFRLATASDDPYVRYGAHAVRYFK